MTPNATKQQIIGWDIGDRDVTAFTKLQWIDGRLVYVPITEDEFCAIEHGEHRNAP